jgi:hypothetical protein
MAKIMTVLDDKLTKIVEHFENNKFSVSCHQFLLDCSKPTILDRMGTIKINKS